MRAIFISYRRDDAEGQAGRLFKDLVAHFGEEAVFMDVAGIEPGRDFRKAIDEHVGSCGVLLALIGKNWIDSKGEGGVRRLDDPGDFVRLETSSALKRDIPVVPVLVHGAQMPRPEQLPEDLRDLAYRNAIELTHARWDTDLSVLIKALGRHVTPAPNPPGAAQPAPSARPPAPATSSAPSRPKLLWAGVAAALVAAFAAYFFLNSDEGTVAAAVDVKEVPAETSAGAPAKAGPAKPAAAAEKIAPPSAPPPAIGPQASFGVADWDGDGRQDLITRSDATADMLLYPGQGKRGAIKLPAMPLGFSLEGHTTFGAVDWDKDGDRDIIARNDATNQLLLYPGRSQRAARAISPVVIGVGWAGYTFFGAADWDRDGHQDIVTRNDTSGELMLYPGESVRRMSEVQPTVIGVGWKGYTPFGIADWDGDGHQDIVTRNDASGDLMLYPGESSRSMSNTQPSKIGADWNRKTFFGMGDWDGDGDQDILGRNDRGRELLLYPGESSRSASSAKPVKLGSGF